MIAKTAKNDHSFWTQEKLAFWVLSILATILFTTKFTLHLVSATIGDAAAESFGDLLEGLAPYRYLFTLGAVAVILPAKRTMLGYIYMAFAAALTFCVIFNVDEIYLWEKTTISNLTAIFTVLAGLFCIISLPKVDLWKKVITGLVIGILLGFEIAKFDTIYMAE